jgi:hypothetical protein
MEFVRGHRLWGIEKSLALPADSNPVVTVIVNAPDASMSNYDFQAPWPTTARTSNGFDGQFMAKRYELDIPASAEGEYELVASADWSYYCQEGSFGVSQDVTISPVLSTPFGFNAGGWQYDSWGRVDDLWFDTGSENEQGTVYVDVAGQDGDGSTETGVKATGSSKDVDGAGDTMGPVYETAHVGDDLAYDIAIDNGTYDVTLHFAEITDEEDIQPGDRVFDVTAQGRTHLEGFDILRQATAPYTPIQRTLPDVEVTDNTLSVTTDSIEGRSMVNGFAIREIPQQE